MKNDRNVTPLPVDSAGDRIHVALVEDDPRFQESLSDAIAGSIDLRLVATAQTRAAGLALLAGNPVDVLLVDLGLPDGSGLAVIEQAVLRWPNCAVMVNTVFGDEAHVMPCLQAGAVGYLVKSSPRHCILDEIRSAARGGSPISPLIARQVLQRFRRLSRSADDAVPTAAVGTTPSPRDETGAGASLSSRENQVLDLVTRGFTLAEAAQLMDISRHTVDAFVRRIYRKLGVNSKAEAIFEARRLGMLDG